MGSGTWTDADRKRMAAAQRRVDGYVRTWFVDVFGGPESATVDEMRAEAEEHYAGGVSGLVCDAVR